MQTLQPVKWEGLLMETLWDKMATKVLEIFMEAAQGRSPGWVDGVKGQKGRELIGGEDV